KNRFTYKIHGLLKNLFLNISFLYLASVSLAQGNVGYLTEELPNDSVTIHSVRSHESLKPEIRLLPRNLVIQKGSAILKNQLSVSPLADFNGSYFNGVAFRTGLGVNIEFQSPKW